MGLVRPTAGRITLDAVALQDLPAQAIARHGLAYVPQGRRLFGPLTVAENLAIGLMARGFGDETRERVLTLFPRLRERLDQVSQTLSGGEQQMLAIGRALCLEPKVLLLDEPSEGLQPSMVQLIRTALLSLRDEGVAVVLVEQRPDTVLRTADRVVFMVQGRVADCVDTARLSPGAAEFQHYVGV
jgi:branched-chain amino acid transport system ATP-binding protein